MEICNFFSDKFSIRFISKEKGIGVFSNIDISSNSVIDKVIPHKISKIFLITNFFFIKLNFLLKKKVITNIFKYLGFDEKRGVFHAIPTMFIYCNHSRDKNNIEFDFDYNTQIYTIKSIKDIKVGDEILLKYKTENFYYKN